MSQDIVEELRNTFPRDSGYAEKANRAADTIEALRAELARIQALHTGLMAAADEKYLDLATENLRLINELDAIRAELAQYRADLARKQVVIEAAKAMRDAAVEVMQNYVLPDSRITDDEFANQVIGIFDGPLQRAFDAARANPHEGRAK